MPTDGEILFGHIYVLPMQGETNIVLDSKIYSPEHVFNIPVVQFAADKPMGNCDYRSLEINIFNKEEYT
ncbi:glyoxalase family protein [Paenibacillus sp. NAIST15-1]|nr:glyoxalase family protein [Paenibacillus sp. NAIST15-1]